MLRTAASEELLSEGLIQGFGTMVAIRKSGHVNDKLLVLIAAVYIANSISEEKSWNLKFPVHLCNIVDCVLRKGFEERQWNQDTEKI